jgi:hypothetical protein
LILLHTFRCQEQQFRDDESIFHHGDSQVDEVSYEYPISYDHELTPTATNLTTRIRGHIYYPRLNDTNERQAFPMLIFVAGRHPDCRLPVVVGYPALDIEAVDDLGRCPLNLQPVQGHLGYAYLARYFASHGYIVISIDMLMVNNKRAVIPDDSTMNFLRARVILRTLQRAMEWNASGQISREYLHGIDLSNRFDFTQIGLMGHSRGGEAVRNVYNMLHQGKGPNDTSQWQNRLSNVKIRAVMEVAPMYFGEKGVRFGVETIPWAMIVAGCEDDLVDYSKPRDETNDVPQ